jgi:DNA-binding NtrC family response regulator
MKAIAGISGKTGFKRAEYLPDAEQQSNNVLLVDDDNAVLFAFQKLCMANDVVAETAESLESALWLLSHNHYDILISDLNLTGANRQEGFEVVRRAKCYSPLIQTYIWTAYDDKILYDKAMETGIEGYMIKPVKFSTLLSIIKNDSTVGADR